MNEYIKKLINFLLENKICLSDDLCLEISIIDEVIPFDFGEKVSNDMICDHINSLTNLVGDSVSDSMIVIGVDPGGNFLVYDCISNFVYYYDLCYNFTYLEESLPEPEDFDIMTGYNSYVVATNLEELFDNILNNNH